jgi:hypothetical protein
MKECETTQDPSLKEQALQALRQDPMVMNVGALAINSYTYLMGQRDSTQQGLGKMPFVILLGDEIRDVTFRNSAIGHVSRLAAALREIAASEAVWSGVAETTEEVMAVSKGWWQIPRSWVR